MYPEGELTNKITPSTTHFVQLLSVPVLRFSITIRNVKHRTWRTWPDEEEYNGALLKKKKEYPCSSSYSNLIDSTSSSQHTNHKNMYSIFEVCTLIDFTF